MTKISVIMPIYNTDNMLLKEAINSILQQTYENFELLLVDDGSTIDYTDILNGFNDHRIKYTKFSTHQGACAARNFAIQIAKGDFLANLDSDDIAMPQRFTKQVDFLRENPHIDVVGSNAIIIPQNTILKMPTNHDSIIGMLLLESFAMIHGSAMFRKKVWLASHLNYSSKFFPAEDYAVWLDLIDKGTFANIDEVLIKYRWHGNNTSIIQHNKQMSTTLELRLKKKLELTGENDPSLISALGSYFDSTSQITLEGIERINSFIPILCETLKNIGVNQDYMYYKLNKSYTRLIRKTKSKKIVRKLCVSPLNNILHIGRHKQLFYYLAKGL